MSNPADGLNVAVVGATGMVGHEMLRVLKQRKFPVARIKALASGRSAGREVQYNGSSLTVQELDERSLQGLDLVLIATGSEVSRNFAPVAVEAGALVVDNSSAWRMAESVPLVVPEVNLDDIGQHEGIIANPNCCTIPLTVVLDPLRRAAGLERVVVATYQSASGAGKPLADELGAQTRAIANGEAPEAHQYPHPLANNVVPGGWTLEGGGYYEEEVKIVNETRKILHDPNLRVVATCVRVPVPVGHGEAVFIETERPLSPEQARAILAQAEGVVLQDEPADQEYPTPAAVAGTDEVFVGRVRQDSTVAGGRGLALWIVSDNLRKGAALNAIQIAEHAFAMGRGGVPPSGGMGNA